MISTLCLKKVPTFKLSVTLSNVNQFSKSLHCWKAYEICYKTLRHYPSHLRHVATLPSETKNANFLHIFSAYGRKCKQIAFFIVSACVIHPHILTMSMFEIVSFPYTDCKYNFPCHCSFTCLLLRSICGTGNSSQQMSLQCLSTVNVAFFSDEDKILIKHIDTFRIHSYTRRGIKMVHLKCNLFAFSSMCAEYLQKI